MPASDVKFGISRHTGALIDSVETTDSVQVKELAGSDGEIARVHVYKAMTEGSVKGRGEISVVPGVGDPGVSGLPTGGVTVITDLKKSESNEDFDGWEYSFKNYPHATAVEAAAQP
jgi:hypothetical protein